MAESDFNAAVERSRGADFFVWKDLNADKTFVVQGGGIDEKEFSGKDKENIIIKKEGKYYFSKDFIDLYAGMAKNAQDKGGKRASAYYKEPIATDILRDSRVPEWPMKRWPPTATP
jgi:hypothetical protein